MFREAEPSPCLAAVCWAPSQEGKEVYMDSGGSSQGLNPVYELSLCFLALNENELCRDNCRPKPESLVLDLARMNSDFRNILFIQ